MSLPKPFLHRQTLKKAVAAAAVGLSFAASATAFADEAKTQYFPLATFRVGAYASRSRRHQRKRPHEATQPKFGVYSILAPRRGLDRLSRRSPRRISAMCGRPMRKRSSMVPLGP